MIRDKRGMIWRLVHSSQRVKIGLYFMLFALQIIAFTVIFHYLYPLLENKPTTWLNSLLFVVETVTTTGFGELLPFNNQVMVLFTIIMMITGIILIFMIIPLFLIPYLSSLLTTTPPKRLPHAMAGHVLIVGYSELSSAVVDSLIISDLAMVIVVDAVEPAKEIAQRYGTRIYTMWGDYGDPATWSNAYVGQAGTIIINEDERTTASIILGIREHTHARIIAVVDKLSFDRYLRYAGAEYVLSPKHVTGQILARHAVISPATTIVEETISDRLPSELVADPELKLRIINVPVIPGSRALGKRLGDLALREHYSVDTILISQGGHFHFRPTGEEVIDTSTMLFLLGKLGRIQQMIESEFLSDDQDGAFAIIAGFGDVGQSAYKEMLARGIDCVVIDQKKHPVSEVMGNAEDEETLREAHIEDARYLIVALNDDDKNIFTTLMARNLNQDLRILARANEPASVDKLYLAGADYVALLPTIGGQVIGGVVLSDIVHVILNLPNGQRVVRKRVMDKFGKTVAWIEGRTGVRIIGIEGIGRSVVRPAPHDILTEGDFLIAIGFSKDLKRMIRLV